MKKVLFSFYLIAIFAFIGNVNAQKKQLTMENAILGAWYDYYPETISQLMWRGDMNVYSSVEKNELIQTNIKGIKTKLLSLDDLNASFKEKNIESLKRFPRIEWISNTKLKINTRNRLIVFDIENKSVVSSVIKADGAANTRYSKVNGHLAYTKDNNLYIKGIDNKEIAVTADTDSDIINGQTVSRSEYGITRGIFWSPRGASLAFYTKDVSNVRTFPLVDISTRVGDLEELKYPMAGMGSEVVKLGVFNLATKNTVWIKPNDFGKNQYLTNISWDLNGEYIYIQVLNRASTHMKLNKYDAKTGSFVKTLLEEKADTWVEPQHKLIFLNPRDNRFIYQTNSRDGYNHLYLLDTDGKLVRQLTKGEWMVTRVLGFDTKGRNLFYESTEVSPLERHLYKVDIKTGKKTQITKDAGSHRTMFSADGKYIIDNYNNTKTPRIIDIRDAKGRKVKNLIVAENKLKDYDLGELSLGKIKSADGTTDLYYRLVKPTNFDAKKKYPVIVYVYGGPHAQMVENKWNTGGLWQQYMAEQGYVVFTVDNRGSGNRGKAFETVIHRNCGQAEMADQMKGVEFLKSLEYVDADRIGVSGWSYGGFMTISLITNYPDVFKVAVAGGPVIDWKWYEIMYGERYMDTPQENPEGYAKVSLIAKAKDLKGKLLICQGAIDNTVLWQHSLNFIRECIKNNVQVDYFPYPRAQHNVHGRDRIHLKQKISNYFDDYLK